MLVSDMSSKPWSHKLAPVVSVMLILFILQDERFVKLVTNKEGSVSFTTDIWSCSVNDASLLSLTAHWIDNSFEKQSTILHV